MLSGYLKSYQRYLKLPTGLRSLSRTDATLSDKNRLLRCDCLLSNRYYTAITRAYVTIFGLSGGGMALQVVFLSEGNFCLMVIVVPLLKITGMFAHVAITRGIFQTPLSRIKLKSVDGTQLARFGQNTVGERRCLFLRTDTTLNNIDLSGCTWPTKRVRRRLRLTCTCVFKTPEPDCTVFSTLRQRFIKNNKF